MIFKIVLKVEAFFLYLKMKFINCWAQDYIKLKMGNDIQDQLWSEKFSIDLLLKVNVYLNELTSENLKGH
ncbi:MAG: hypothetical protein K0S24_2431 [Sphingobacterium sp.]|nr:hypothetical protein [Sphingobacterium sp.]